jgi:hypothetical protein
MQATRESPSGLGDGREHMSRKLDRQADMPFEVRSTQKQLLRRQGAHGLAWCPLPLRDADAYANGAQHRHDEVVRNGTRVDRC